MSCNRIENGSCIGCNILSLLGEGAATKEKVDTVAADVSRRWCPTNSGGIDNASRAILYNLRPSGRTHQRQTVW